jgi:hypothetical protein
VKVKIGSEISELESEFTELNFEGIEEKFWLKPEERKNAGGYSSESKDSVRKRTSKLEEIITTRSEDVIILVGHSQFIKIWQKKQGFGKGHYDNCEMRELDSSKMKKEKHKK